MPDWQRREFSIRFSGVNSPNYGRKHPNSKHGIEHWRYGKPAPHAYKVWYPRKDGTQVCFRSTWEARVAAYLDSHDLEWEYETKMFPIHYEWKGKEKQFTYRADFWLPQSDSFIEVKGLWRPEYLAKFNALKEQYADINIEVWDRPALESRGIPTGKK
jgi:hypothetical protein